MTIADSLIADVPRLSPDEARFIRRIMDRVLVVGRRSYSPWVAADETRDMPDEAAQEALDLAVYVAMDAVKRADARPAPSAAQIAAAEAAKLTGALPEPHTTWDMRDGNAWLVLK